MFVFDFDYRDTYIVCIGDCLTSVFAGFVIFAIIGYMAHDLGMPIDKVASEGKTYITVIYCLRNYCLKYVVWGLTKSYCLKDVICVQKLKQNVEYK